MRRSHDAAERGVIAEFGAATLEEPADSAAVAARLRSAAAARAAVVAVGGGTLQSIGNPPRRCEIALSLRRLDRIAEYDPRDLTIGIEAGATLETVQRTLAEAGQFIPFDAPAPARATVGGTLAAGWAGPRRTAYGYLRDLLIGTTVALTDGSLARAGGMVVKNVTGYDTSKLHVGALGTLGVIVRANFKALPLPPVQRIALATVGAEHRERALAAVAGAAIEPAAALAVRGFAGTTPGAGDDTRLVVLHAGTAAVVDRATRDLRSALGAAGVAHTTLYDGPAAEAMLQALVDASVEIRAEATLTYRLTGRPSEAWGRAETVATLARDGGLACELIVDLRSGDVLARVGAGTRAETAAALPAVDTALRRAAPRAAVLAGDARLRALVDAWGAAPSTMPTLRALKAAYDPAGILAPGRYVGGI